MLSNSCVPVSSITHPEASAPVESDYSASCFGHFTPPNYTGGRASKSAWSGDRKLNLFIVSSGLDIKSRAHSSMGQVTHLSCTGVLLG
jgi:hypothetical protein